MGQSITAEVKREGFALRNRKSFGRVSQQRDGITSFSGSDSVCQSSIILAIDAGSSIFLCTGFRLTGSGVIGAGGIDIRF